MANSNKSYCDFITVAEVADHLGLDIVDDMIERVIINKMNTAYFYLQGALGDQFDAMSNDCRIKELALIIVTDLYENRGLYSTVTGNLRRLVDDMCLQLRLEYKERYS